MYNEKNMTKSGTHDNDAFNFVQVAMQEFHGFTPIAVYRLYAWPKNQIWCLFPFPYLHKYPSDLVKNWI